MQNDCNETNVRMWFGVLRNQTLMVYREGSADVARPRSFAHLFSKERHLGGAVQGKN